MAKTPEEVKALSDKLERSPAATANVCWHVPEAISKVQAERLDEMVGGKAKPKA